MSRELRVEDEQRETEAAGEQAGHRQSEEEQDDPRLRVLRKHIERRLKWSKRANYGKTEAERDAARDEIWKNASPLVEGKPGTGKTTNVLKHVREAAADGLKVMVCSLTAQHASRMKES
eukprot:11835541-Karenia_brevis.AAC.1